MNPRQRSALVDPLNSADDYSALGRHRFVRKAGDGADIIVVLAIDR